MINQLPTEEWIDEQAQEGPEQEFVENEVAIENTKEDRRKNEEEMKEIITSVVKIKPEALEEENKGENEKARILTEEAEKVLATKSDSVLDEEINTQLMIESNLVALTTGGATPGHYYDHHPYRGWGRVYRHNEGGVTTGSSGFNLAANKMFPYAYARGDGSGISDDNDVTTWVKLYFAFWPGRNGHIRVRIPYITRGWYQIRSNDKWYNSKEAKVDLEMHVKLHQNYWGGHAKKDLFQLSDDNINSNGRIDVDGSFYSGSIAVGANKWVIAEVAVRARTETEGSGSTARLDFRNPDYVRIPHVRFEFS
ncbi:hypothetical protein KAI46_12235 [bacterium]|nr:hypothetical protein [bacterium]